MPFYTETDSIFTASAANSIVDAGSGEVIVSTERTKIADAITFYTETDTLFTASPANSITDAGSGEVIVSTERTKIADSITFSSVVFSISF